MENLIENTVKSTSEEENFTLRYKIKAQMAMLPQSERLAIKNTIKMEFGIHDNTYSNWINMRKDSKGDIPGTALIHFANLLNTTPDQLLNL